MLAGERCQNFRDHEQINRLVILTRRRGAWPAKAFRGSFEAYFRILFPIIGLEESLPAHSELTRNNASLSRMLSQTRNQVRSVMEIPGKFRSRLKRSEPAKINLDKAIGLRFLWIFVRESIVSLKHFSFHRLLLENLKNIFVIS